MTAMARHEDPKGERSGKDLRRRQRGKNIALLVALLGFVVLVYLVSIARMGNW